MERAETDKRGGRKQPSHREAQLPSPRKEKESLGCKEGERENQKVSDEAPLFWSL